MFFIFLKIEQWSLFIIDNHWKFQCHATYKKRTEQCKVDMQIAWLKLKLVD